MKMKNGKNRAGDVGANTLNNRGLSWSMMDEDQRLKLNTFSIDSYRRQSVIKLALSSIPSRQT